MSTFFQLAGLAQNGFGIFPKWLKLFQKFRKKIASCLASLIVLFTLILTVCNGMFVPILTILATSDIMQIFRITILFNFEARIQMPNYLTLDFWNLH